MKKSDLASVIREEFLSLVKEATYEVSADDVDKIKDKVKDEDTIKVSEDIFKDMTPEDIKLYQDVQRLKHTGRTLDDEREAAERKKRKKGLKVSEDIDDDEGHKAATKGAGGKDAKGVAAQATAALKAQTKKKALTSFMDKMKAAGVVSADNKVLDAGKYKEEFAKFKASL